MRREGRQSAASPALFVCALPPFPTLRMANRSDCGAPAQRRRTMVDTSRLTLRGSMFRVFRRVMFTDRVYIAYRAKPNCPGGSALPFV